MRCAHFHYRYIFLLKGGKYYMKNKKERGN